MVLTCILVTLKFCPVIEFSHDVVDGPMQARPMTSPGVPRQLGQLFKDSAIQVLDTRTFLKYRFRCLPPGVFPMKRDGVHLTMHDFVAGGWRAIGNGPAPGTRLSLAGGRPLTPCGMRCPFFLLRLCRINRQMRSTSSVFF